MGTFQSFIKVFSFLGFDVFYVDFWGLGGVDDVELF